MRKCFFNFISGAAAALLLSVVSGCSTSPYDDPENWAIIDSDTPVFFSQYDLIYLYPCQEKKSEGPYMNWVSGSVGKETRIFVRMVVASQFGQRVRVFSPFVPLLSFDDYDAIIGEFKKSDRADFDFYKTKLKVPIDYMVDALNVYFSHYNSDGHPLVIYGHEQGGLVLYEAMKRCSKVCPGNGFVVGYFFGVPGVTPDEIKSDFGGRGIKRACRRDSVGVIAICNIRRPVEPLDHTLAMPNGVVINPLNWCIDATPADNSRNPGALFFDRKQHNPLLKVKQIPKFCGAVVDPENGIVNLTGIPKDCRFKLDEDCFGSDAWGIFSKSVVKNAQERVAMFKFLRTGVEMPE